MVSGYAVIEGGVVVNAVLAEEDFAAEQGWVLLPEGVGPNWLYDGSTFKPTRCSSKPSAVKLLLKNGKPRSQRSRPVSPIQVSN